MPFREEHIKIEDTEKKAQFFFDMNAKMDEGDGRGKKRKHEEGPPKAAGPCWFCLSSAEVEKHFIAKFKSALRKMYKRQGKAPVFFEKITDSSIFRSRLCQWRRTEPVM